MTWHMADTMNDTERFKKGLMNEGHICGITQSEDRYCSGLCFFCRDLKVVK